MSLLITPNGTTFPLRWKKAGPCWIGSMSCIVVVLSPSLQPPLLAWPTSLSPMGESFHEGVLVFITGQPLPTSKDHTQLAIHCCFTFPNLQILPSEWWWQLPWPTAPIDLDFTIHIGILLCIYLPCYLWSRCEYEGNISWAWDTAALAEREIH